MALIKYEQAVNPTNTPGYFYTLSDGTVAVRADFITIDSDGRNASRSIAMSLQELMDRGLITKEQVTAFTEAGAVIINALCTTSNLTPILDTDIFLQAVPARELTSDETTQIQTTGAAIVAARDAETKSLGLADPSVPADPAVLADPIP